MRSYGAGEKEIGNEGTMEAYLDNTMRWVKEVWRILKPTGSFVLNIGDCWAGSGGGGTGKSYMNPNNRENTPRGRFKNIQSGIYKTKQLLSVSSFAYCKIISETDFVCRNESIWCKPNVPSPIRSRLKHSHEKLFWFVKDAKKYYFTTEAWLKDVQDISVARYGRNANTTPSFADVVGLSKSSCFRKKPEKRTNAEQLRYMREKAKGQAQLETSEEFMAKPEGSFHKHAEKVIEHSWRIVPVGEKQNGFELSGRGKSEHIAPFPAALIRPYVIGMCPHGGTVLDPFLGSRTTMRVAMEEGRNSMGIELNPNYILYSKKRLNWGQGLNCEYLEGI